MRNLLNPILALAFLSTCGMGLSQEELQLFPLDSFAVAEVPKEDDFERLNHSRDNWRGIIRDGEVLFFEERDAAFFGDTLPISIDDFHEKRSCRIGGGDYHFLHAHNAWYIGTNRGEWGGMLHKFSDGFKECSRICLANVNQLYAFEEKTYLVEGLSHLSLSGGNIIELKEDQTFDTLLTVNDTPKHLIFSTKNEGFLLTTAGIYSINSNMDTVCIFREEHLGYLYPNNLVLHKGILYATMRGGILTYTIETKQFNWLARKE